MPSKITRLSADEAPVRLSLRERNKLDKISRIRAAALELFDNKGYDATTTREIAELADVGIGTVFMYANDKRDLLFLIFNDDLDEVVEKAFANVDTQEPLTLQVFAVFSRFYEAFHPRANLSRILLRELVFFSEGKQADQFLANRQRILTQLEQLASQAIESGKVVTSEDSARLARAIFFLYSGEVRLWLSEPNPDLSLGLTSLRKTLALLGRGLGEQS